MPGTSVSAIIALRTRRQNGLDLPRNARSFAVSRSLASSLLRLRGRNQRYGGLAGQQEERERLLQIQADGSISMAEITDGDVLADVQVEIAATSGQHESASDGGRPDDLIVDQSLNVFQHRVS